MGQQRALEKRKSFDVIPCSMWTGLMISSWWRMTSSGGIWNRARSPIRHWREEGRMAQKWWRRITARRAFCQSYCTYSFSTNLLIAPPSLFPHYHGRTTSPCSTPIVPRRPVGSTSTATGSIARGIAASTATAGRPTASQFSPQESSYSCLSRSNCRSNLVGWYVN